MRVEQVVGEAGPGRKLGKYRAITTLGQGGMGTVYLALASGFGEFRKLLVVKELRQDLTRRKGFVRLFMDEARLAARLAHPNVVQTFEASQEQDRYFLAMEYLDGQSLSALINRYRIAREQTLPLGMHIQILCDVLAGLHYAHELRDYDGTPLHVVHRDVSPQNVFVTYDGQVKVVDFGVAKAANAGVKTAPGVFVGKFSYAAPEQLLGQQVDARTDLFAIGVMLWQAIAGRRFAEQQPTAAAFRARTEGAEPRIAQVVPSVDRTLADICDRALAVDPDQRFATAQEFRNALQEYQQKAGGRVDTQEFGQLIRELFENERRSTHTQIEAAMKLAGDTHSSVELLVPAPIDREETAVADLSSLIDVSLERDDQKIREGYAHSKITLLPMPSQRAPEERTIEFTGMPPSRRPIVFAAIAGLTVVASVVVWSLRSSPAPQPPTPAPVVQSAPAQPVAAVPSAPASEPAAEPPMPDRELFAEPKAANPAQPLDTGLRPQPSATLARRVRPALKLPVTPPVQPVQPVAPRVVETKAPEPVKPAVVTEGGDLQNIRRPAQANTLDVENPYQ